MNFQIYLLSLCMFTGLKLMAQDLLILKVEDGFDTLSGRVLQEKQAYVYFHDSLTGNTREIHRKRIEDYYIKPDEKDTAVMVGKAKPPLSFRVGLELSYVFHAIDHIDAYDAGQYYKMPGNGPSVRLGAAIFPYRGAGIGLIGGYFRNTEYYGNNNIFSSKTQIIDLMFSIFARKPDKRQKIYYMIQYGLGPIIYTNTTLENNRYENNTVALGMGLHAIFDIRVYKNMFFTVDLDAMISQFNKLETKNIDTGASTDESISILYLRYGVGLGIALHL